MRLSLSVSVMHHPSRAEDIPPLLSLLDAPGVPVRVVTDTWNEGLWRVATEAWVPARGATHHMVVQDDVLPCREFLVGAREALAARPEHVVSFYCAREVQREAVARGLPWATMGTISGGPCVAMPVGLAAEWLSWCRQWVAPKYRPDDGRLSLWLLHTARRVWYTCPSLVEHLGWDRSLRGNPRTTGGRPRIAAVYIGSQVSPRGIPWHRTEGVPHDAGVHISKYKGWRRG